MSAVGQGFFVTGTGTDVGKTISTVVLMHYFQNQGKIVSGFKPVASGCARYSGQLRNQDALVLQSKSSHSLPYELINPYAFEPAVSPHIAAKETNRVIDFSVITANYAALAGASDIVFVEGVGGWYAPLSDSADVATLAKVLALPIILVVGIQLGGINYARLTFDAICASGLPCVGWIANCVEPEMVASTENIATIRRFITAPLLGIIPYDKTMNFSVLAKGIQW